MDVRNILQDHILSTGGHALRAGFCCTVQILEPIIRNWLFIVRLFFTHTGPVRNRFPMPFKEKASTLAKRY
jgi:hypothetical protein